MMKRIFAALLASVMMMSMFAACGSSEQPKTETPAQQTTTNTTTTTPTTEEKPVEPVKAISLEDAAASIKGENTFVTELTMTSGDNGITVECRLAGESSEDDVKAVNDAIAAVVTAEDFVAANLFNNTQEKINKVYDVKFYIGDSAEAAYTSEAKYASSNGRKGMIYASTKAWTGPEAVTAE